MAQAPRDLTPHQSPRHHFGAELRYWRTHRGLSQDHLGRLVLQSGDTIAKVEKAQRWPTHDLATRCDRALDTGGQLARPWLLVQRQRISESRGQQQAGASAHDASGAPLVAEGQGRPGRDHATAAPIAVGGAPWEATELLERIRASDVSAATVDALHVTTFELCCVYGWKDAALLRAESLGWLREVERLLRRPVGLRAHQELLTAAGWLALLVGCLEYDMQLRPAAEATRRAALQLATEGGNTEIAAWAWEMAAWFALTQGNYREVLATAAAGQTVVGEHTAAVQLIAQEAKARSRMNDAAGVRTALDHGRRLLDRFAHPSRPDHHFVVDPDKWDFYAMDAYRIVGENELARHHAEEVLRLGTRQDGTEKAPMRMAEARLALGAVTARDGELDQAVEVAMEAFRARRRSLPQLLMIAGEVADELRRRDPQGQRLGRFRDAIRSACTD